MLRNEIIRSCRIIEETIRQSDIVNALQKCIDEGRRQPKSEREINPILLKSLSAFSNNYSQFTQNEILICTIFGINIIDNSDNWVPLLSGPSTELMELNRNIRFIINYLPKILQLFENESLKAENASKTNRIAFIFPEDDSSLSNLERISEGLIGIHLLKDVIISIFSLKSEDLTVLSIDSGSDKFFDFSGSGELVKELKELVLSIWDRIVTNREKRSTEHIENIAKTLPLFERIAQLQENGAIEPEGAEIIRRNLILGVNKFVKAGAYIPEQEEYSRFQPRKIMAPEQKLISAPVEKIQKKKAIDSLPIDESNAADCQDENSISHFDNEDIDKQTEILTDEEEKMLKLLLKKARKISYVSSQATPTSPP